MDTFDFDRASYLAIALCLSLFSIIVASWMGLKPMAWLTRTRALRIINVIGTVGIILSVSFTVYVVGFRWHHPLIAVVLFFMGVVGLIRQVDPECFSKMLKGMRD